MKIKLLFSVQKCDKKMICKDSSDEYVFLKQFDVLYGNVSTMAALRM